MYHAAKTGGILAVSRRPVVSAAAASAPESWVFAERHGERTKNFQVMHFHDINPHKKSGQFLAILSGSNHVVQVHVDGSHFRMCARQIFQHHAAVTAVLSGNAYGRIGFISGAAHIFEIGHRILLEMVLIQYMR